MRIPFQPPLPHGHLHEPPSGSGLQRGRRSRLTIPELTSRRVSELKGVSLLSARSHFGVICVVVIFFNLEPINNLLNL